MEEVEDTALGNGGLGRLAACFVESAATMGYPLYGVGLYYMKGLFKQTFDAEGHQVEVDDDWTSNGESWFEPHEEDAVIILGSNALFLLDFCNIFRQCIHRLL